jgi:hypothetical protein
MSKHTPGPWNVRQYTRSNTYFVAPSSGPIIYETTDVNTEGLANAHLIAASPELYAFAQHVVDQIKGGACGYVDGSENELLIYAQTLIAKAEGK